jgi:hypothetical protein
MLKALKKKKKKKKKEAYPFLSIVETVKLVVEQIIA